MSIGRGWLGGFPGFPGFPGFGGFGFGGFDGSFAFESSRDLFSTVRPGHALPL